RGRGRREEGGRNPLRRARRGAGTRRPRVLLRRDYPEVQAHGPGAPSPREDRPRRGHRRPGPDARVARARPHRRRVPARLPGRPRAARRGDACLRRALRALQVDGGEAMRTALVLAAALVAIPAAVRADDPAKPPAAKAADVVDATFTTEAGKTVHLSD